MEKSLLKPYKSIGLVLDHHPGSIYGSGEKSYLVHSCKNFYKIYSLPDLKVKLLGPHLKHPISCI